MVIFVVASSEEDIIPFFKAEDAVYHAKQLARQKVIHRDQYQEGAIKDFVFYASYSRQGAVWVKEVILR